MLELNSQPMEVIMEGQQIDHRGRAQSNPDFLRNLNLFHLDEEAGSSPLRMGSGWREEDFSNPMGSGRRDEDYGGFHSQMGNGMRDARVVCETLGNGGKTISGDASPKMRKMANQKGSKQANVRRSRSLNLGSRNPLLACFVGASVLSARSIHLYSNCESPVDPERTFFSLIPVDRSRVNETTGEPQSPQLSCLGQVKHRREKSARPIEVVTEDLARMDINDGVIPHSMQIKKIVPKHEVQNHDSFKSHKWDLRKEDSIGLQFEEAFKLKDRESFKLHKDEYFKYQKEEAVRRQKEESCRLREKLMPKENKPVDKTPDFSLKDFSLRDFSLPGRNILDDGLSKHFDGGFGSSKRFGGGFALSKHFDGSCEKNDARLTRCKRVVELPKVVEETEKVKSPTHRNSIRHLNHFLKQKLLGRPSLIKGGFICGWSFGEESLTFSKSERSDSEKFENREIDLSRFASGVDLPDVRVHSHQREFTTRQRSWKEESRTEREE